MLNECFVVYNKEAHQDELVGRTKRKEEFQMANQVYNKLSLKGSHYDIILMDDLDVEIDSESLERALKYMKEHEDSLCVEDWCCGGIIGGFTKELKND